MHCVADNNYLGLRAQTTNCEWWRSVGVGVGEAASVCSLTRQTHITQVRVRVVSLTLAHTEQSLRKSAGGQARVGRTAVRGREDTKFRHGSVVVLMPAFSFRNKYRV